MQITLLTDKVRRQRISRNEDYVQMPDRKEIPCIWTNYTFLVLEGKIKSGKILTAITKIKGSWISG